MRSKQPAPAGLPDPVKEVRQDNKGGAKYCPKCGEECRIVSNYLGVNAHCNKCKDFWAVSGPLAPPSRVPISGPRPLYKQTSVEPNWERALEEPAEYEYENTRGKKFEKG